VSHEFPILFGKHPTCATRSSVFSGLYLNAKRVKKAVGGARITEIAPGKTKSITHKTENGRAL
jgi:hypothetical protein